MTNNKVAIVIPSRLESTRLKQKPLIKIAGREMILRVIDGLSSITEADIYVATDSIAIKDAIYNEKYNENIKVILSSKDGIESGTDRVFDAIKQVNEKYDYVVNLQGDMPNLKTETAVNIVKFLQSYKGRDDIMMTFASIMEDNDEDKDDVGVVKIALAQSLQKLNLYKALYFSRYAIPYNASRHYHHLGIYAYSVKTLEKFASLPRSDLEKSESLEQLRALENDIDIYVKIVNDIPISVDTQRDLDKVENYFAKK